MALNPGRGPTYKVVLLGELGVGKTSLFRRLKENTFDEFSTSTAGIDSCTKVFKIDGESITMSIWDTAGVERFRTLTRNYYRNAHAAVFIYSVTDVSSLHFLTQWEKDTQNFAPNALRMLIGNKTDLDPEVDEYTAEQFSKMHAFDKDGMISCKTGKGIHEAFEGLAKLLHEKATSERNTNVGGAGDVVQVGVTPIQGNSSGGGGGGCNC